MPWWSLPETIRAAAYCFNAANSEEEKIQSLKVINLCHKAFMQNYVRPDLHYLQYQVRSAEGSVIDTIPATPDVDPGYHTGLSIIDAVNILSDSLSDGEMRLWSVAQNI